MPDRPGILVTRAEPGAAETAERLADLGYRPIVSPVLAIAPLSPAPELDLTDVSGLIFTSANGVRAFAEMNACRDLPAWCVGPATEAAAGEAGFAEVRCAHGDADTLVGYILSRDSGEGVLLHIANDAAAGQVAQRLSEAGRETRFLALYTTKPQVALTQEAAIAFGAGKIHAVLIHSAKGASAFAALIDEVDLGAVSLIAVSERAARPARDLGFKRVQISGAPNESALLNALRTVIVPVSG